MEFSKAGTQNFVRVRLACFLVFAFMALGKTQVVADPHYTIDLINDVLREAQNSEPSPKVENGDNNFVARAPIKEADCVLKYTLPFSTIEVVCPQLNLPNKPLTPPLQADPLSKSLITPEIEIIAPKGTMDCASAEPDWRILPVNKEIESFDFFYKGLLVQSEKKPNYLEQIQLGKTLVNTTSRYRESLFAADYFQVGGGLISTNFSSLIRSSEDDLDKKILQNVGLVKNLSPQDPLYLKNIQASSQLTKDSLQPIISYTPIVSPKNGDSWALKIYPNQSTYSSNLFEYLDYEPVLSKPLETILYSKDILKAVLDVTASKASQELLSGAYLANELQENLQLTLTRQIKLNLSKNSSKSHPVFILDPIESTFFTISGCSNTKKDRSTIRFTTNLQIPLKTSKFSSYAKALTIARTHASYRHPNLQQPYWPLDMTFGLTTLTTHPLKKFFCSVSEIEFETFEVPLFTGVTRAVFEHPRMSDISLNQFAQGPIQNAKILPAVSSHREQQTLVLEEAPSNLVNKTLQLDLLLPIKTACSTAPFEELYSLLPTQPKYVQGCHPTRFANQNILSISRLIDLPNPPINNKGVINLSIQNHPYHVAQTEPTELFLNKLDSTAYTVNLHSESFSQGSIILCGSALSKHSLHIISTNEANTTISAPSKATLQCATSFNKKNPLLISIKPLQLADSKTAYTNTFLKKIPDEPFNIADFSMTPDFRMTTFPAPSSNNDYRLHYTYEPIELLDSSPYEITYCFGSSAMDTNRSNRITHLLLSSLPTLSELDTDDLNDDFMCEVKVAPHMSQDGYIFSARFTASDKEGIDPLPHHIIYLLDRGSSVEGHRFNTFKNAIVKSISQLNSTTLFNVWFFDQKIDTLSHQDLHNTKASIHLTKQLLSKVPQGKKSSFPTLLQALSLLNQKAAESNELYTVILLSNGSMMKNIRLHRESLLELANIDSSAFSLYTAAVSDHNNLEMLELLAHIGHGEMFYTKTHASFPRKFAQLVKKVSRPIATGLHVTCFSDNPSVSLHHMNVVSEQLYADQSYSVYGSTSDLSHINIIIQGERNGRYVNIHKKIPLKNTTGGQNRTEKTYYTRKALSEMIEFIFSNDQTHLIRAKELLSPYSETLASR